MRKPMAFLVFVLTFLVWIVIVWFLMVTMGGSATAAETKIIDKNFWAVSAYLVAMTVFDVETTFSAIRNGAHEANPIMKPFIKRGRPATYTLQLAIDALCLWAAYEMKRSKNDDFKKAWWVIPSVVATGHGIAGGLNLRYVW